MLALRAKIERGWVSIYTSDFSEFLFFRYRKPQGLGIPSREAFVKIPSRSHVSQHNQLVFPIEHQSEPVTAKTYATKHFVLRQPDNLIEIGRIGNPFRVFIVPRYDSPLVFPGDLSNCPLE